MSLASMAVAQPGVGRFFAVSDYQRCGAVIRLDQPNFAVGHERTAFGDAVATVDQPDFVVGGKRTEFRHCLNTGIDCGGPFHDSMHSIEPRLAHWLVVSAI